MSKIGGEYWDPKIETMPKNEIKELQNMKVKEIVKHAYNNSIFYRQKFDTANVKPEDIKNVEDLKRIPIFRKDELRVLRDKTGDPFGGLLSIPFSEIISYNPSTGTTGIPTFMAISRGDQQILMDVFARMHWMHGLRPNMKVVHETLIWHWYIPTVITSVYTKFSLKDFVLAGLATPLTANFLVDALLKFKPEWISVAYSPLLAINIECKKRGIDPKNFGVKYMQTGRGEPITETIRKELLNTWNVEDVFDVGGVGEIWLAYGDCYTHTGAHFWEDIYYVELIDPETSEIVGPNERGEFVVTNLEMKAFPTIRFGSEDYADMNTEKCGCGRTHVRLTVYGRTPWLVDIAGKKIHPEFIKRIVEKFPETREAAFTILKYAKTMDKLRLKASYNESLTKDSEELKQRWVKAIEKELKIPVEIEWVSWEELPKIFHKIARITDLTKKA